MGHLLNDDRAICVVKFGDAINSCGVLCDQGTFDEEVFDILKFVLSREFFHVCNELCLWDANEGIFDSGEISFRFMK